MGTLFEKLCRLGWRTWPETERAALERFRIAYGFGCEQEEA
jgi:hypothetical protein